MEMKTQKESSVWNVRRRQRMSRSQAADGLIVMIAQSYENGQHQWKARNPRKTDTKHQGQSGNH